MRKRDHEYEEDEEYEEYEEDGDWCEDPEREAGIMTR